MKSAKHAARIKNSDHASCLEKLEPLCWAVSDNQNMKGLRMEHLKQFARQLTMWEAEKKKKSSSSCRIILFIFHR